MALRFAAQFSAAVAAVAATLQLGLFLNVDPVSGGAPGGWLANVAPWLLAAATVSAIVAVAGVSLWARQRSRRFDLSRAAFDVPLAIRVRWPLLVLGLAVMSAAVLVRPDAGTATSEAWRWALMLSALGAGALVAAALASAVLTEEMATGRSRRLRSRARLAVGRRS